MKNFIEFQKGTIPLIISVPHGGTLECEKIPKRLQGVLGIDGNTIKITKFLIKNLKSKFNERNLYGKKPSYVISNVRRSKIDMNRKEEEAFVQSSSIAKQLYIMYHEKVSGYVLRNIKQFNRSLLLDIHGFETTNRPSGYRDVDVILGTNNLESFFLDPIPKREWGKNIRGNIIKKSLNMGIAIAPGHPKRREYALTGGFITKQYGASQIPNSQAMQIEFSERVRIENSELREIVLDILVNVLFEELIKF
ncbi:MAG: hypothetical protein ACFFE4_10010 [Candidatus Thorarchaeota archaeon]